MKKLEIYQGSYGTAFFVDGQLIQYVHENDGTWREEYFNPIIKALGCEVVSKSKLTKDEQKQVDKFEE